MREIFNFLNFGKKERKKKKYRGFPNFQFWKLKKTKYRNFGNLKLNTDGLCSMWLDRAMQALL